MSVVLHTLVDRRLVHKTFEKNILVANLRRALPMTLSADVLAKVLEFSPQLYANVHGLYVPWSLGSVPGWSTDNTPAVVASYLYSLINSTEDNYEKRVKHLKNHDRDFVVGCYHRYEDAARYVLRSDLNEVAIERLVRLLEPTVPLWTENEKYAVATQLEKANVLSAEPLFYGLLHVDTTHEFFFEHCIDHLPANMLVEAVRQFVLAGCHIYVDVPTQGTQFILSELNGNFSNYLDLWRPIVMCARVVEGGKTAVMRWDVALEVEVAQQGSIGARFKLVGEAIRKELFERVRHHATAQLRGHWFALPPHIKHSFAWRGRDGQEATHASLVALGNDRVRVRLDGAVGVLPSGGYDAALFFDGVGTILGQGTIDRAWSAADGTYAELLFVGMTQQEIGAIIGIIIHSGMLIEDDVNRREPGQTGPICRQNEGSCSFPGVEPRVTV